MLMERRMQAATANMSLEDWQTFLTTVIVADSHFDLVHNFPTFQSASKHAASIPTLFCWQLTTRFALKTARNTMTTKLTFVA